MSAPLERKLPRSDPGPLLLAAFNATADAFVVMDNSQCVQHINLAASALLGCGVVEAVGRPWRDIVQFVAGGPADDGADCTALAMEAKHATLRARDGSIKAVAAPPLQSWRGSARSRPS